jgi:hypothetical protein
MSPQAETANVVPDRNAGAVTSPAYLGDDGWIRGAAGGKADDHALSNTERSDEAREELNRFYSDLFAALEEFIRKPSATASGAAVVATRVAMAHGLDLTGYLPLPRLTRAEREELNWP